MYICTIHYLSLIHIQMCIRDSYCTTVYKLIKSQCLLKSASCFLLLQSSMHFFLYRCQTNHKMSFDQSSCINPHSSYISTTNNPYLQQTKSDQFSCDNLLLHFCPSTFCRPFSITVKTSLTICWLLTLSLIHIQMCIRDRLLTNKHYEINEETLYFIFIGLF